MAKDHPPGRIELEELEERIGTGEIDTVISAISDMQGRLMGKRISGDFFLEHARDGTHFCTYLLGTDMEMRTPPGYRLMSWQTGYGDWLADPDWSTLRVIPWLEKTALVLADVRDESTGELVPVAPRTILRRQVERVRAAGFTPIMASELEFYLLRGSYEDAAAKRFHELEPFGWYNEDYHLLQATKAEPLYRQFRNRMTAAGIPTEFSKGEAAPGQHEVNLRYADALESADRHALFKHGLKEMAWQNGHAVTFMAKPYADWTGNSAHVHVSLLDASGEQNVFHAGDAANAGDAGNTDAGDADAGNAGTSIADAAQAGTAGNADAGNADAGAAAPDAMSDTMRHFLGGLMHGARELAFFLAPFVNSYKRFAPGSWAPTNIVWGRDNRTCGFRVVGHGRSLRIENRFPGGDANPYLAYAAVLGAGLHGIQERIEPPAEHRGNGYEAPGAPRVPVALWQAVQALEESELARRIFGEDVVQHYLNNARIEQEAYDTVVTCWERERYLERG